MHEFKACDLRGRAGEGLVTPQGFHRLGAALAALAADRGLAGPLVVAGDVRPSTPDLRAALVRGLMAAGREVVDCGVLPTPAFYFAVDHYGACGGATVTASHNPPAYNGLKFILGGRPPRPEDLAALRDRVAAARVPASVRGHVRRADPTEAYVTRLAALCPTRLAGMRLVVDSGNGCYGPLAGPFLRGRGAEADELFAQPDGRFPHRHPNSAIPAHLGALCARVRELRADLGIGFDGDGDRVSFVDEAGAFVPCDVLIALLARQAVAAARGQGVDRPKVVYDIKCSRVVAETVAAAGGLPLMEKSGHGFLKARVQAEGAVLGGEVSGHYFYPFLGGGDDGLYTAWRVAALVRSSGGSLARLAAGVPRYAISPDVRIPCEAGEAQALVDRLAEALAGRADLEHLDGLRAQFPEGWALARPSITEPAITFRFEAQCAEGLPGLVDAFLADAPAWRDKVRARLDEA